MGNNKKDIALKKSVKILDNRIGKFFKGRDGSIITL